MKKMNVTNFIDSYNAVVGGIIAVLSYVLGPHWVLFAGFLLLNLIDWITGWMKSRKLKKTSSKTGLNGIIKKFGYWLMILFAFCIPIIFIEIGKVIGIDLGITSLLGWFVLASLLINEARSICENFVEAGYKVPKILVEGLEVSEKMVNRDPEDE